MQKHATVPPQMIPDLSEAEVSNFNFMLKWLKQERGISQQAISTLLGYSNASMLSRIGKPGHKGYITRPSREKYDALLKIYHQHGGVDSAFVRPMLKVEPKVEAPAPVPEPGRHRSVMNHLDRANTALLVALKELDEAKALSKPLLQPGIEQLRGRLQSLRSWLEVS